MARAKLFILVHTCAAYEQPRCGQILETWASQSVSGVDIGFVTDNPSCGLPGSICMGPYPTGATYHPETFVKMLRLFRDRRDLHDWFMVVDDDTYVYIERLLNFLDLVDPGRPLLIGDFINWPSFYPEWPRVYQGCMKRPPPSNFDYGLWPGGGPGLLFSASCVDNLLAMISELETSGHPALAVANHDVWLHRIIDVQGQSRIARLHCPGFHQFGDEALLLVGRDCPARLISVHLNHQLHLMKEFHALSEL